MTTELSAHHAAEFISQNINDLVLQFGHIDSAKLFAIAKDFSEDYFDLLLQKHPRVNILKMEEDKDLRMSMMTPLVKHYEEVWHEYAVFYYSRMVKNRPFVFECVEGENDIFRLEATEEEVLGLDDEQAIKLLGKLIRLTIDHGLEKFSTMIETADIGRGHVI